MRISFAFNKHGIAHIMYMHLSPCSVVKGLSSLPLLHVYAPTTRCGTSNCPINLCLIDVSGVQLHPDFQNRTNQVNCPDNENEATMYAHLYPLPATRSIMFVICSSYVVRRVEYTNIVVVETNGSCSNTTMDGDSHILLSNPICTMCMCV